MSRTTRRSFIAGGLAATGGVVAGALSMTGASEPAFAEASAAPGAGSGGGAGINEPGDGAGGGGGSSFVAPEGTAIASAVNNTGNGSVSIRYDPATDSCPTPPTPPGPEPDPDGGVTPGGAAVAVVAQPNFTG
jgi:hypothetical protein